MSEDNSSATSRHRSPAFTPEEVKLFVQLVEKYKQFVMNNSIRLSACQKKDEAWEKITREFNKKSTETKRSVMGLKNKWSNLKKEARKHYFHNVLDSDVDYSISNSVHAQIASILSESHIAHDADNDQMLLDGPNNSGDDDEDTLDEKVDADDDHGLDWEERDKQQQEASGEGVYLISRKNRCSNFTPSECGLLLKCIRKEKEEILSKNKSSDAMELKNHAWRRVTASYNKLSPQKRSSKMLKTKFENLKRMARQTGCRQYFKNITKKHDKLIEDSRKDIKKEPNFSLDTEKEWFDDCDDVDTHKSEKITFDFAPDPLSSVLNGDSGMGTSHTESINSDNPEVVKLKLELLNYQMETAKMERKRIEDLIQEDAKARETRAIEAALRLRAARLDTIAAEERLGPAHHALHYPPNETPAQQYFNL